MCVPPRPDQAGRLPHTDPLRPGRSASANRGRPGSFISDPAVACPAAASPVLASPVAAFQAPYSGRSPPPDVPTFSPPWPPRSSRVARPGRLRNRHPHPASRASAVSCGSLEPNHRNKKAPSRGIPCGDDTNKIVRLRSLSRAMIPLVGSWTRAVPGRSHRVWSYGVSEAHAGRRFLALLIRTGRLLKTGIWGPFSSRFRTRVMVTVAASRLMASSLARG
jgi:hypothetical protein